MRKAKSDKVILEKLALKRPLTIYALNKITSYSTSTIHASIHKLMMQNLVKKGEKGYSLTVAGLVRVLQNKATWECIDEIAISNKKLLPEYFDLWQTFEGMNVKEIAVKLLKYGIGKLSSGLPAFPEQINGRKPTFKDWLPRLAIYPYDALLEGVLNKEETDLWHLMLLEDPRAEKLFVSTLKWMITSHKSGMESFSRALEKHHELKYLYETIKPWVEIELRELIERVHYPPEQIKAIKQNKELWEAMLQLYPEVKDERELSMLLEKLKPRKRGTTAA